jgi:hypothetical protein
LQWCFFLVFIFLLRRARFGLAAHFLHKGAGAGTGEAVFQYKEADPACQTQKKPVSAEPALVAEYLFC